MMRFALKGYWHFRF